jgi:hypothetical protein
MSIGGGLLTLIVIVLLLVFVLWNARKRGRFRGEFGGDL